MRVRENDTPLWQVIAIATLLLVVLVPACWSGLTASTVPTRYELSGMLNTTGQDGEGYYAIGQVFVIIDQRTEGARILDGLKGGEVRLIIERKGSE